jgi:hypothetical protein
MPLGRVRRALSVVAAEESFACEDDLLTVDPVLKILAMIVHKHMILDPRRAPSGTQSLQWNGNLVGKNVIAPLSTEGPCKTHE